MANLLRALNLKPTRRMLAAAASAPALATADVGAGDSGDDIEVIDADGAEWDDREQAPMTEAEAAAWAAGKPLPPAEPPQPAGSSLIIPVSLSVKVERKFKYVEVEKIKIEGELKLATVGDEGLGIVKTADYVGVSLDKGKLSPAKRVDVDLKKLAKLLLGIVETDTVKSKLEVDSKLECRVGPGELNVSLGIAVSCRWYAGSLKLVAVAKEQDKEFQFADVSFQPFAVQVKDEPIEIEGVKGKVSGKLGVTFALKPAWGQIGTDLAARVGRPVMTTIAEAMTADAAIAAGFVAGAAAQVFAYVKAVSEWRDVRGCAAAAERGWLSFRSGFGAVYGVKWPGGGVAPLHQQGHDAGLAHQMARLRASRERVLSERGRVPANFDADYLSSLKCKVTDNPNGLGLWIEKNYRREVIAGFLQAYAEAHSDDWQFKANYRALRTLLGAP